MAPTLKTFSHAVVICNGSLPRAAILRAAFRGNPFIICADGGANAARRIGIVPHVIIGDLDSTTEETMNHFRSLGTTMIHQRRQSDTDFEKALKHCLKRQLRTILVLGATGKLTDHTLGNFSIASRYRDSLRVAFIDSDYIIERIDGHVAFDAVPGERISLVPFPKADGITTHGLKYSLTDESLALGEREGTCNQAASTRVEIRVRRGALYLFRHATTRRVVEWIGSR